MAGKKGKGRRKPKQRDEPPEEPSGEGGVRLPPGSVQVLTKRERDWLPPVPENPPAVHGGPRPEEPGESEEAGAAADRGLIGKRVVDTDGLELGYVDEVTKNELTVGEGPFSDWLKIHRNYVGDVGEEVRLLEPLQELLQDVEVFDSEGKSIGWVTDVIATGDVVDGIIVKGPRGNLFVLLEDICSIGGTLTLDIPLGELRKQAANRRSAR